MTGYVHPAAYAAVDELSPIARDTLRQVIANDGYAATFQTLKQYRAALLRHLDNRDAADRAHKQMDATA